MRFHDCIALVGKQLQRPLPGLKAQVRMSPVSRTSDVASYGKREDPLRSGVLLLLYPQNDSTGFLLIERSTGGTHGGQIGLPGGKYELADLTIQQTALRETQEEIGVDVNAIKLLGSLTPLYIPASGYEVFPQVGYLDEAPHCHPNPAEVKRIIEATLMSFLNPALRKTGSFETSYGLKEAPYYDYQGDRIWGATSMILSEFIELFR